MFLEEVKQGAVPSESASMGVGKGIVVPIFEVESDEPFNWMILNHFQVLLHGGNCLIAKGYYGPHMRCDDMCPFSREYFKSYSEHRTTCQGDSCSYPYCKETMDLYMHFRRCRIMECKRCQAPVNSIMNEFVQELVRKEKEYMLKDVAAQSHEFWRNLLTSFSPKRE